MPWYKQSPIPIFTIPPFKLLKISLIKGSIGPHVRVNVKIIVKWLIHYFLIIFGQLVIYHILPISNEKNNNIFSNITKALLFATNII